MPQRYTVRKAGGPSHWGSPFALKDTKQEEYHTSDRGWLLSRDCYETCAGHFEGPNDLFTGRRPANFRISASGKFDEAVYLALTFELRELP